MLQFEIFRAFIAGFTLSRLPPRMHGSDEFLIRKVRFETVAVTYAKLCMQKAAAQQDAWAQRSVLRGAACKVASTQ